MAEALVDAEACSTTMDSTLQPNMPGEMIIEDKDTELLVAVHFDDDYLRTAPGIVRFLQVVVSVIALICVTSSGTSESGYLLLPLSWHLRVFVFVAVCGLLTSLMRIVLHITGLVQMLPIQWDLFDLIVYCLLSFLSLSTASLVASAIDSYQKSSQDITEWTIEQLIVAVVLGYINMVLYGVSAGLSYSSWKGVTQFMARRFSSSASQRSQQSAPPATTDAPVV